MAENSINQPRIDFQFVNADGRLTQYGYSVLSQLIARVGGSVGEILNGRDIVNALGSIDDALGRLDALAAGIAAAQLAIEQARASEATFQPPTNPDPISTEVTWQI